MMDIIDPLTDPLNQPFERANTIKEITVLYLQKGELFYIDNQSGGKRERAEQFIKFLLTLSSPDDDNDDGCCQQATQVDAR